MEKVTYLKFKQDSGKAMIVLTALMIYCTYKIFGVDHPIEYIIIAMTSLIGIVGVRRLFILGGKAIEHKQYKLKTIDRLLTGYIIIGLLAFLSFYVFFVKGLYGLYKLSDNFSWTSLIFRLFIILLSYQLVSAVSRLQTVYLSIKNKTVT